MNTNTAPRFNKVELLLKSNDQSITKIVFEDCGLMITGDYLVILIDEEQTTTGRIFPLKEVSAYKTHK